MFFQDFDQLGDGTVSQDVIETVLCEVAGFTDDESCQLIARSGVNGAGRLNINEFLRKLVARVDSDATPGKDGTDTSPKSEVVECAISMEQAGGEAIECAICMEAISEVTTLPCRCKFDYCQPCWDRALANSFSQCGQARCPSCRSLVRVDFDPDKTCLVFSAETVDMTYAAQRELQQTIVRDFEQGLSDSELEGRPPSLQTLEEFARSHDSFQAIQDLQKMRNDIVTKLRHQAMPALKAALQRHGEDNPHLLAIRKSPREALGKLTDAELEALVEASSVNVEEGSKQSEVVDSLVENATAIELCSCWAQQNCPAPKCVCGSFLQRVDAVERFRQSPAGERLGSHSNDEILCHLRNLQQRNHTIIICDICEESLPITSSVWTCRNRTSTILHATSYDICDRCFVRHVCNESEERVKVETETG